MKNSEFSPAYYDEYLQQVVDNYNLLYVACTRPKANLFILKSKSKSKLDKDKPMNSVAQLITQALGTDSDVHEFGTLVVPTSNTGASEKKKQMNPLI